MLVATNKELYVTLPKRQKQLLSRSIVHAVRSQNPPGRFLQRDPHTDLWFDVGDARATEKTSQALREGAPKLREKIRKEGETLEINTATAEPQIRKKAPPEAPPIIVHPPPNSKASDTSAAVMPPPPPQQHPVAAYAPDAFHHRENMAPPPPSALDPAGEFSFGSFSIPEAPDMGLENGFSFGSVMSMDPQHRSSLRSGGASIPQPPTGLYQGHDYSFGSIAMSDAEQRRIEAHMRGSHAQGYPQGQGYTHSHASTHAPPIYEHHEQVPQQVDYGLEPAGLSAGSMMSFGTIQALASMEDSAHRKSQNTVSFEGKTVVPPQEPANYNDDDDDDDDEEPPPQPVDYGLETGGLSAGSMMSIGTIKLEDMGTSFGSVMSFATKPAEVPDAVDGGLDGIGTSFGSMTLDGGKGDAPPPLPRQEFRPFGPPEPLNAAEPTLLHQQRSKGNLLDCDDSDSEDERRSAQSSVQKSADWEKLKATFEAKMKSGEASSEMPPSLYGMKRDSQDATVLPVAVGRSGSNEYVSMPPPAARRDGDDWQTYEASLLNRGDSLGAEQFNVPKEAESSEGR